MDTVDAGTPNAVAMALISELLAAESNAAAATPLRVRLEVTVVDTALAYPAGLGVHAKAPLVLEVPTGQRTHALTAGSRKVPAAHSMQLVRAALLYDPGEQGVQADSPLLAATCPTGQAWQASRVELANVPDGHGKHAAAEEFDTWPGAQSVQDVEKALLLVPAGHV